MFETMFSLHGRTVLVSGASSGIGLHVAQTFAAAGAAVALAARRSERIEAEAAALKATGRRAAAVYLDVTDPHTIAPAFDAAERQLDAPVDVLINNAGVLHAESFVAHGDDDLDRVIDTNLKGAFRVAQEAARRMLVLKRGVIVNVASTAGLRAGAFMASYAASKAGLIQFSQVMALELAGKNIRVNVLCPGNIETDMQTTLGDKGFHDTMLKRTPLRRFGRPDDLEGAFLLLASNAGRYMTGAVLTVDGGQMLSWM
ncbi:MAG: SDR family oxidoreductase [Betaproteobacteria bacterium]|nr:SDR family oxidoreductase [Betaproteobacteria bacterium]